MSSDKSLWYRLGFAFELARSGGQRGGPRRVPIRRRDARPRRRAGEDRPRGLDFDLEDVLATGGLALAARLLDRLGPGGRPTASRLLGAGVAGAAAALAVELLRPLLDGVPDGSAASPSARRGVAGASLPARLLAGAGRGLTYGVTLERWLPAHPVLKGAAYGSAEYVVGGAGELARLLGARVPFLPSAALGPLLDDPDPDTPSYVEHVVFGVALALLYGSSPSSNGIRDDDG